MRGMLVMMPIFVAAMAIAWLSSFCASWILVVTGETANQLVVCKSTFGLQRIFSIKNVTRVAFGIAKIGLVTAVVCIGLWGRWNTIMNSAGLDAGEVGSLVWSTTIDMCFRTALVLLVLAVLDYGFQRWRFEQDLRMTDEEMREEMKMMNGDPQIVARRRAVHGRYWLTVWFRRSPRRTW